MAKIVKDFLGLNDFDNEKAFIGDEWWMTKSLIKASEDRKLEVFSLDLMSIDLGVMPWTCVSVLHFLGHIADIERCDLEYPVILSPSGWVMNGWHRICKAIMEGKKNVSAVRFVDMPEPDGIKEAA